MISEGIYVTLGKAQLEEKSYRSQLQQFAECDGEHSVFYWRLSVQPKRSFTRVFIVIGNKVRFKATFLGYVKNRKVTFNDGRTMYSPVWMQLIDFEKLPRPYEYKKGFQGIRYKD